MFTDLTRELMLQLSCIELDYDNRESDDIHYIIVRMQQLRTAVQSLREAQLVNSGKCDYWVSLIDELSVKIGTRKEDSL